MSEVQDYTNSSDPWFIELTDQINEILNKESMGLITANEWNNIHNVLVTATNHNANLIKNITSKLDITDKSLIALSKSNSENIKNISSMNNTLNSLTADAYVKDINIINSDNNIKLIFTMTRIENCESIDFYPYVDLNEWLKANNKTNLSNTRLILFVSNTMNNIIVKEWDISKPFNDILYSEDVQNCSIIGVLDTNTTLELSKRWANPEIDPIINSTLIPEDQECWLFLNKFKNSALGATLIDRLSINGIQNVLNNMIGNSSNEDTNTHAEFKIGTRTLLVQWGKVTFNFSDGTYVTSTNGAITTYNLFKLIKFPIAFKNSNSYFINATAINRHDAICTASLSESPDGTDINSSQITLCCSKMNNADTDTEAYWFAIGWKD